MSHSPIRKDKTCLNCRHVVEQKFCPNCGQENTDSRKTFHHLFIHFFEDLTHYENAFWKTIKNLLFKPSTLTKEYLSGKRLSYLAPVRLYIFISFLTFLLIALFPNKVSDKINETEKQINIEITKAAKEADKKTENNEYFHFKSMKEIDSIQKYGNEKNKLNATSYWAYEKVVHVTEKYSKKEIIAKFIEAFFHNLPKILFIIMPFSPFSYGFFTIKRNGIILIMEFLPFITFHFYC